MTVNPNIYLGLDIGSTRLSAALCEISDADELQLKGVGSYPSRGFEKGRITDYEALKKGIHETIAQAELDGNCSSNKVFLSISSVYLTTFHHVGMLQSEDESGQISYQDKINVIKQSKNVALPTDKLLLHAIPLVYKVDGVIVQNPVGVFGKKLEVQTYLILVYTDVIQNLKSILNFLGYTIKGFVFDALAAGQIALLSKERKEGAFLIEIGGSQTRVSLFKNDLLCHSWDVPIGGQLFSSDIATCLKVSFSEAERLKLLYGDVLTARVSADEILDISSADNSEKQIKRFLLSQILEARAKELFGYIVSKVKLCSDPNYQIVLGGGGSLLKGLLDMSKQCLNSNSRDGLPDTVKGIIESSTYSTAVGLVLYGLRTDAILYQEVPYGIVERIKQWLRRFF
jgi:cell division protein FtsA